MKKALISFISLIMLALIIGCAADIILEPPETLEGNYVGQYIYRIRGTGATEDTSIQRITWIFTETGWNMKVDFDHPDLNMDFCILIRSFRDIIGGELKYFLVLQKALGLQDIFKLFIPLNLRQL